MKARPASAFTPLEHTAAQSLQATIRQPLPPATTCIPLVVAAGPHAGPDGQAFQLPDGRVVSLGPPQDGHLADVAAHVLPARAVTESSAVGFVMHLQIAEVNVSDGDGVNVELVVKLLPRELALGLPADEGAAAVGVFLADRDGDEALVIAPADDPMRAVSALDGVGWVAPDLAPPIVDRLLHPDREDPAPLPLSLSQLYLQGWVARVLESASGHGPDVPRTRKVADRPPTRERLERLTASKLVAAAADGRIPSPLHGDTFRWAGTELSVALLSGIYGTPGRQIDALRQISDELADEVERRCVQLYGGPFE